MTDSPFTSRLPTYSYYIITLMTAMVLFGLLMAAIPGVLSFFTPLTQSLTVVWELFGAVGLLIVLLIAAVINFRRVELKVALVSFAVGFLFPTAVGIAIPGLGGTVISWIGFIILCFLILCHQSVGEEPEDK